MKLKLPLSASRLNTYFKCPFKFYMQAIKYPKHKTGFYHDIAGSFVHEAIEIYFNNLTFVPTANEIKNVFESIYEDMWGMKPVPEEKTKIERCIKNFVEMEQYRLTQDDPYCATWTERMLRGGIFRGIIDWYHESGVVRDWKTSKSYELTDDMIRQGIIYKHLLERNNQKVEIMKFEMLYHAKTVIMPFPEDKWMTNCLRQLKTAIKENEFPRNPSYLCDYCEYQMPCEAQQKTSLWEGMGIEFIDNIEELIVIDH